MKNDMIYRQAAIDLFPNDALEWDTKGGYIAPHLARRMIEDLPSAQPDRKLIDDYMWKINYMWKIKQNISPHTAAEEVFAIKYYLVQIYEQIYGKGEKPKWMT